jgi:hypothetical protein
LKVAGTVRNLSGTAGHLLLRLSISLAGVTAR